jgi:hypothetical protein
MSIFRNISCIIFISLLLIGVSCNTSKQDIKDDMQDVTEKIEEALVIADVALFKEKSLDALDDLNTAITNLRENAEDDNLLESNIQELLVLAKMRSEIEAKLRFLETKTDEESEELSYSDTVETSITASGTAVDQANAEGTTANGDTSRYYPPIDASIPDRPVVERPATDITQTDRPEPDPMIVDTAQTGQRLTTDLLLQEDFILEIRNDLETLKIEIERYMLEYL